MSVEFIIDHNLIGLNEKWTIGAKWVTKKTGKRVKVPILVLSNAYRQCKLFLISQFMDHDEIDRPKPPYMITIQSYQFADKDAYYKIILDALEESKVIDNDNHFYKWGPGTEKIPISKGEKEHHYIRVEHYDKV